MTESAVMPTRGRNELASGGHHLTALAIVALVVTAFSLAVGVRGWDTVILLLALLTFWLGAIPIVLDFVRPAERRQILMSLTSMAFLLYLASPVFTQYFLANPSDIVGPFHITRSRPRDIVNAQLVTLTGFAMLLIGFYSPFGRLSATVFPKPTREWPPQAALFVAFVILAVGWLTFVSGQLGLIPSRLGSGAMGALADGSYLGIALLTLTWIRHRRREALLLLAMVIPLAMGVNFFTGSKLRFLSPALMIALAYIVTERRLRTSWIVVSLAVMVVIFPISNFYRYAIHMDNRPTIGVFLQNPGRVINQLTQFGEGIHDWGDYFTSGIKSTGARLDSLGTLAIIVKDTPERVPYQGGWSIGYIALSYIPRIIWADKPGLTIGEWVSQTYGSRDDLHTDVGPTWMGELYFNWGYIGVVFGMFAMGMLCRVFQDRLFFRNATIPALAAAVVVLYSFTRGVQASLLGPVNQTVFNIIPIALAHVFVGLSTGYHRTLRRSGREGGVADMPRAPAGGSG